MDTENVIQISENDKKEYLKIVKFIQEKQKAGVFSTVGFELIGDDWYYGHYKHRSISNEQLLKLEDKENICQGLQDTLVESFGENFEYGCELSYPMEYFVVLDNVMVMFPEGFGNWKMRTVEELDKKAKANKTK